MRKVKNPFADILVGLVDLPNTSIAARKAPSNGNPFADPAPTETPAEHEARLRAERERALFMAEVGCAPATERFKQNFKAIKRREFKKKAGPIALKLGAIVLAGLGVWGLYKNPDPDMEMSEVAQQSQTTSNTPSATPKTAVANAPSAVRSSLGTVAPGVNTAQQLTVFKFNGQYPNAKQDVKKDSDKSGVKM